MVIYHEIKRNAVGNALTNGLKRTSQGAKSKDKLILRTNDFLDENRPTNLKAQGVSRNNNLYGYLGDSSSIIDIKDGKRISLSKKMRQSDLAMLRLDVGPQDCWVSDLDKYDAVKEAIAAAKPQNLLLELCDDYWASVLQLKSYEDQIHRPEIMITSDIEPTSIHVVE